MTVKGRKKAKEAGAAAIVVSNHGGRVLDQCPATAEVLPEIAAALKGTGVKILVDGGIRTGVDVFKGTGTGCRRRAHLPTLRYGCLRRRCRGRQVLHRQAGR